MEIVTKRTKFGDRKLAACDKLCGIRELEWKSWMKALCILLLSGFSVSAQSFQFGIRGGVPLTSYFQTGSVTGMGSITYVSDTKRYTFGPTVELGLPMRLSVGADLLYKRLDFDETKALIGATTQSSTTANSWEVPITARYRLVRSRLVGPYARAGASFRKLTGVNQDSVVHMVTYPPATSTSSTANPSELRNTSTIGLVLGAGLDLKIPLLRLTPELRYTRWRANLFQDSSGLLSSNRDQVEFLLGITW
jgi:hypothetical protein